MEKFLTKHTKLILFHWANKTGLHNSGMTVSEWVGLIVDTGIEGERPELGLISILQLQKQELNFPF